MNKKILFLPLIILVLFLSCTGKKEKLLTQKEIKKHQNASLMNDFLYRRVEQKQKAIDEYVDRLSLEEKVCQLFIENLEGNKNFLPVEKMTLVNPSAGKDDYIIPGGYIFFGYNIADTRDDMKAFNKSIYEYCKKHNKIPPYLAVDQEGGSVSRLKKINTKLLSPLEIASLSIDECKKIYSSQAEQMHELGFHMNLAPVVEVITEENKTFLDDRSFGSKEKVIAYGSHCITSYEDNSIATVLKHFPGNTNTDPHKGLPLINLPENVLMETLVPFEILLEKNPSGVLMSHAITTAIESEKNTPSCLSDYWVNEILRKKFGYDGIIFSDDIFMGALKDNGFPPEIAVVKAIKAGIDVIMISEKRIAIPVNLIVSLASKDEEVVNRINQSVKRIIRYKIKAGILSCEYNKDGSYSINISNQIY
ncbi:MAG: glycoside hydrolase family 3 protein [Treponema sp.]|nr:glycoside hydrolase family 3 protein [Treponema sp.]